MQRADCYWNGITMITMVSLTCDMTMISQKCYAATTKIYLYRPIDKRQDRAISTRTHRLHHKTAVTNTSMKFFNETWAHSQQPNQVVVNRANYQETDMYSVNCSTDTPAQSQLSRNVLRDTPTQGRRSKLFQTPLKRSRD